MPNPYGAPEISVQDVAAQQQTEAPFVLLDVRETDEIAHVQLTDPRVVVAPLSRLAREQTAALPPAAQDKDAAIVVYCHHGVRSAQVTVWLQQQGWTHVVSMAGGIDAWARRVDPSIGLY
jgi:rhodanese-related sulfurtransferase